MQKTTKQLSGSSCFFLHGLALKPNAQPGARPGTGCWEGEAAGVAAGGQRVGASGGAGGLCGAHGDPASGWGGVGGRAKHRGGFQLMKFMPNTFFLRVSFSGLFRIKACYPTRVISRFLSAPGAGAGGGAAGLPAGPPLPGGRGHPAVEAGPSAKVRQSSWALTKMTKPRLWFGVGGLGRWGGLGDFPG